jgi:hypothetical protein
MHPSTQSFYSFSPNSCLLCILQSVLYFIPSYPSPDPRSEERTENSSSTGCEAHIPNLALDRCIETSPRQKERELLCVASRQGTSERHARQRSELGFLWRGLWRPPGGGVDFASIAFLHASNWTWLIPPAAKLGKLSLEPLYLGQRPGLHCSTISRCGCRHPLLQDENPLLPASSKDWTSIRRIRGRPSRIGRAPCSLYLTQVPTQGIAWSYQISSAIVQDATRDRVSITSKPAPLQAERVSSLS